jgi:hypothetical protein
MQSIIDDLQRRIESLTTASQPSAASEAKINAPETFDGENASQLRNFLTQVRLVFDLQPSRYPTDAIKVKYASSYLRGPAFSWIQPYLDMEDPPIWLDDFSLFIAEITNIFGDPDLIGSATRNLRKLRQTGSVASYVSEFRRHSTLLSWGEQALNSQFLDGLNGSIKDELARSARPTELKTLIETAVRIDIRLRERDLERGETSKPSTPPPRKNLRAHATPTTVGNPRANPVERVSTRPAFQRLSDKQKDYRRSNNLCMYCGAQGHAARECPISPTNSSRPVRATRTAFATPRTSGNDSAQTQ